MRVTLPPLFPAQEEIAKDPARFKVVAAGRRFGKTKLASLMCVQVALAGGKTWWVAPSFPLADIGWREVKRLCVQVPGAYPRLSTKTYYMPGGGFVQARSAATEASLRGEGLDFVVIDECAFMPKARWTEELRPTLSDRDGRAMFISTPRGRNWFYQMWLRGQDEAYSEWRSWQLPSTARPTFKESELEIARSELSDRVFRQEYLAEFMAESGEVFRNVAECSDLMPLSVPDPDATYVAGVDLGRHEDSTVVSVIDASSRQQVLIDAYNNTPWEIQEARMIALHEAWGISAWVVESNFNSSYVGRLQAAGLPVVSWHSTNATKAVIVNDLALALETGSVRLLMDQEQMNELNAYTFKTSNSGLVRYMAPEGEHDDRVIALALAWSAVKKSTAPSVSTWGLKLRTDTSRPLARPGPLETITKGGRVSPYNARRPGPASAALRRLTRRW